MAAALPEVDLFFVMLNAQKNKHYFRESSKFKQNSSGVIVFRAE
jgi:hypothetical protein